MFLSKIGSKDVKTAPENEKHDFFWSDDPWGFEKSLSRNQIRREVLRDPEKAVALVLQTPGIKNKNNYIVILKNPQVNKWGFVIFLEAALNYRKLEESFFLAIFKNRMIWNKPICFYNWYILQPIAI